MNESQQLTNITLPLFDVCVSFHFHLPYSNGEVHKYQLDMFGRRLSRTEYIAPRDPAFEDPFVIILDDGDMSEIREAILKHEGCNVYGWFDVQRMGGNIHFSGRMHFSIVETLLLHVLQAR